MRPLRPIAFLMLLALGVVPAAAQASGDDVVSDCTKHGTLTRTYSQKDYKQALASLPADVDEYGDCRNVIRQAQVAGASKGGGKGGGGTGGGGGGSAPTSAAFQVPHSGSSSSSASNGARSSGGSSSQGGDDPTAISPDNTKASNPSNIDENKALIDATRHGGDAVKIGKDAVTPGTQSNSSFASSLPAPVIGVLTLLGVGAIAFAAIAIRRRRSSNGLNDSR